MPPSRSSAVPAAGVLFDAFSGVLFMVLGILVARQRPRRGLHAWFGAYAVGLGVLVFAINVLHLVGPGASGRIADGGGGLTRLIAAAGGALAGAALLGLAAEVSARRRAVVAPAAALFVGATLAGTLPQLGAPWDAYVGLGAAGALVVGIGGFVVVHAGAVAAGLALAIAACASARTDARAALRLNFLSIGIVPYTALAMGDALAHRVATGTVSALPFVALVLGGLAATAALWAVAAAREPRLVRPAAALAAAIPALALLGVASYVIDPTGNTGLAGAVRTTSVLLLAYGVVRLGILGDPVRLDRSVRRGTLALAFAVAFLVGGRVGERLLDPPLDFFASVLSTVAVLLALDPLRRAADLVVASAPRASEPTGATESLPDRPPRPGDLLLGRYRVDQFLGEGGQGSTWLCHDAALGRAVVAKAVPLVAGAAAHLEEARRAATVHHPGVVQVFDVAQGPAYGIILMEYAPGGSLASRLARSSLGERDLMALAEDLLSALAACHARRVVHGDLKPENVLYGGAGRAKLADFGSARAADAGATARTIPQLGTVAFMAPEQVRGESATLRSDVHAAGVVLALAATGRHPFQRAGMDDFGLRDAIVRAVPDLAGVPPRLEPVLRRALDKAPAARYPDARAMLDGLRAAAADAAGGGIRAE